MTLNRKHELYEHAQTLLSNIEDFCAANHIEYDEYDFFINLLKLDLQ